jgi:hypothetical protein
MVVWDRATGERLGELVLPRSKALGSAGDGAQTAWVFSPDGKTMFTTTAGGRAVRWDLSEEGWVAAACRRAGRSLSPEEWRALVGTKPPPDLACDRK